MTIGTISVRVRRGFRLSPGDSLAQTIHGLGFVLIGILALGLTLNGVAGHLRDHPASAAIVVLLLGVPHGGFDVALAHNRWDLGSPARVAAFLCAYLALAGVVLAVWWLWPLVALPCFLLVSGFHFAGDWKTDMGRLARGVVGTAIITAPALLHGSEVAEIFTWIAPASVATSVPDLMAGLALITLPIAGLIVAVLSRSRVRAALEAATVLALALLTDPLCFFVIYFCGLHSIRHVHHTYRELRPTSVAQFFASSLPYAPLAIVGTLLGGWWITHHGVHSNLLGCVFLALAALTAPHMLLVDLRKPSITSRRSR